MKGMSMKVTILSQHDFKRALSAVSRFVPTKTTIPSAMNIKIDVEGETLRLQATDLTMAMTYEMRCASEKNGTTTLPSKLLNDLVSNLPPNQIELECNNDIATIACGKFSSTINGISSEQFPEIPSLNDNVVGTISASLLREALNQVTPASADAKGGRPILEGVFVQLPASTDEEDNLNVTFSAADGFRLATKNTKMSSRTNKNAFEVVIPAESLTELTYVLAHATEDVVITLNDNLVGFRVTMENATASVVSRTIDGKYPDIARVIPTVYLAQVTVSKQELQKAVRVSKLFATGNILRFKVNALLGIQLSANDSQKGNNASVVEADIVGPEVEIALNINYVDDALSTIPTDKVVVEFQSGQQPAVFIPNEDTTFKHIVMPMMVR
jgi:DNA polymerase-3 subunit beta